MAILFSLSPEHGVTLNIGFAGICCFSKLSFCPIVYLFTPPLRHQLLPFRAFMCNLPSPAVSTQTTVFFWLCYFPVHVGPDGVRTVRHVHTIAVRTASSPPQSREKVPVTGRTSDIHPFLPAVFPHRYITSGAWFRAPVMRLLFPSRKFLYLCCCASWAASTFHAPHSLPPFSCALLLSKISSLKRLPLSADVKV